MKQPLKQLISAVLSAAILVEPTWVLAVSPSTHLGSAAATGIRFQSEAMMSRSLFVPRFSRMPLRSRVMKPLVAAAAVLGSATQALAAGHHIDVMSQVAQKAVESGLAVTFIPQHIVQRGDTLLKIAQQHHITLKQILELNPGFAADPNTIFPKQAINLPGDPLSVVHAALPEPTAVLPSSAPLEVVVPSGSMWDALGSWFHSLSGANEFLVLAGTALLLYGALRFVSRIRTRPFWMGVTALGGSVALWFAIFSLSFQSQTRITMTPHVPANDSPQVRNTGIVNGKGLPPIQKRTPRAASNRKKPSAAVATAAPAPTPIPIVQPPVAPEISTDQTPLRTTPETTEEIFVVADGRPVLSLSWAEIVERLARAHRERTSFNETTSLTMDTVKALQEIPLLTVTPLLTWETASVRGAGPVFSRSFPLTTDPLASIQGELSSLESNLVSVQNDLSFHERLAELAAVREAYDQATNYQSREAALLRVRAIVLPVVAEWPAGARLEISNPTAPIDPDLFREQERLRLEARQAAIALARSARELEATARREFVSSWRRVVPSRLGVSVSRVAWGELGPVNMFSPTWTRYGGVEDWSGEKDRLDLALSTFASAQKASLAHHNARDVREAYRQAFADIVEPAARQASTYLGTQSRKHAKQSKAIAPVIEALSSWDVLSAEKLAQAAPRITPKPDPTTPDIGVLSGEGAISISPPVIGGTSGTTSASPFASTIENQTYTFGMGGTITQLLNGSRLNKRMNSYLSAVQEGVKAEQTLARNPTDATAHRAALVSQYAAVQAASRLTAKERTELQIGFSGQGSKSYGYWVFSLNKGQEIVVKTVWHGLKRLAGVRESPDWTYEMEQAVWVAKLSMKKALQSADRPGATLAEKAAALRLLADLYTELQSRTPEALSGELLAAWKNAPETSSELDLAAARLRLKLLEEGKTFHWRVSGSVMPFMSITTPGTLLNKGVIGVVSTSFAATKMNQKERDTLLQNTRATILVLERRQAFDSALAQIAKEERSASAQTQDQIESAWSRAAQKPDLTPGMDPSQTITNTTNQPKILTPKIPAHVLVERLTTTDPALALRGNTDSRTPPDLSAQYFYQKGGKGLAVSGTSVSIPNPKLTKAKRSAAATARLAQEEAARKADERLKLVELTNAIDQHQLQREALEKARLTYVSALEQTRHILDQGPETPGYPSAIQQLKTTADAYYKIREDVRRTDAALRERVKDMPYAVVSGAFEETPLNALPGPTVTAASLKQSGLFFPFALLFMPIRGFLSLFRRKSPSDAFTSAIGWAA